MTRRQKRIEVGLPLEAINKASAREKAQFHDKLDWVAGYAPRILGSACTSTADAAEAAGGTQIRP